LAEGDALATAITFADLSTHATSTAFSLGDVILEAGRYYRVTTAGTTAGTKPSFFSQRHCEWTARRHGSGARRPTTTVDRSFVASLCPVLRRLVAEKSQGSYAPPYAGWVPRRRGTTDLQHQQRTSCQGTPQRSSVRPT
jgi:hypothetical protein